MAQYIDKDALVAEIERQKAQWRICKSSEAKYRREMLDDISSFLDTIEVKEVWTSIPDIDDTLKEEGLDPDSKEAKVFKESYYMALEKLKAQEGEEL